MQKEIKQSNSFFLSCVTKSLLVKGNRQCKLTLNNDKSQLSVYLCISVEFTILCHTIISKFSKYIVNISIYVKHLNQKSHFTVLQERFFVKLK